MAEPQRQRLLAHLGELVGVVVALDREVLHRRPQVLAKREDVAIDRAQVHERLAQLRPRLSQPDHDRRLGVDRGGSGRPAEFARVRLRPLENAERSVVSSSLPDRLLQPRDRLDVVVEDVRPCRHHRPERRLLSVEVGDQDLDAHAGARVAQAPDRVGEDARAAVGQIVAGHACDHDVIEAQAADGLGHAARLVQVVDGGPVRLDRAEPAGAGAGVAEDHDRGRSLVPALAHVRALSLRANGVQR